MISRRKVINGFIKNYSFKSIIRFRIIPNMLEIATVVIKGNRTGCNILYNVNTRDVLIEIKNRFLPYNNERFSIGIKFQNEWFSIGIDTPVSGIKGSADAIVKVVNSGYIIIDDLSKYMDVSGLLSGMNP